MRLASEQLSNVGLVVSIDTGDAIQLHPKNKRPIGIRHALYALENVYSRDVVGSGPRFQNQKIDGNKIILRFETGGSDLVSANQLTGSGDTQLDSFAIAGNDQVWHWADAVIDGDQVIVSSSKIATPVAVRYAWAMNPSRRNLLYNRAGLPASPFRSDTWPLFDPEDEVVEVSKPVAPEGYTPKDWQRPAMLQVGKRNASLPRDKTGQKSKEPPADHEAGLAPEITDLSAEDISYALEKNIPDLKTPYITTSPEDRMDGIATGSLNTAEPSTQRVLAFAADIHEAAR